MASSALIWEEFNWVDEASAAVGITAAAGATLSDSKSLKIGPRNASQTGICLAASANSEVTESNDGSWWFFIPGRYEPIVVVLTPRLLLFVWRLFLWAPSCVVSMDVPFGSLTIVDCPNWFCSPWRTLSGNVFAYLDIVFAVPSINAFIMAAWQSLSLAFLGIELDTVSTKEIPPKAARVMNFLNPSSGASASGTLLLLAMTSVIPTAILARSILCQTPGHSHLQTGQEHLLDIWSHGKRWFVEGSTHFMKQLDPWSESFWMHWEFLHMQASVMVFIFTCFGAIFMSWLGFMGFFG